MRVDGRSGIAGADDEVEEDDAREEDCGVDVEKPVEDPMEDDRAVELKKVSAFINQTIVTSGSENNKPVLAPAAPPRSQGFGGDTVAMLRGAGLPSA